ncbi:hypothetical protein ACFOPX_07950 [Helicobacter baculiformis]|uniref:Uncharacterized protein n=1 Tax=Helicobacter baculiformis TaxID=427351 RepID=A0ABV7ZJI0_9HELI|nr:hypothetical protein [Helicobacter baculiformis]
MWCLGIEHKENGSIDALESVLCRYGFSKLIGGVYILHPLYTNPLAQICACLHEIKTISDNSKLEVKSFKISELNDLADCLVATKNTATRPKTAYIPPRSTYDHIGEKSIALSETIFKDYDPKDLENAYFLYTDAGIKEEEVMCGFCLYLFKEGRFEEINRYKCPLNSILNESFKAEKQAIVTSMKHLQAMLKTNKLDSSYKLFVIGDNQAVINNYRLKTEGFISESDFTSIEYKWCRRNEDACNKVVDAIVNLRG